MKKGVIGLKESSGTCPQELFDRRALFKKKKKMKNEKKN